MPKRVAINENLFETWSPESAWVLGLLFTDGYFGKENSKGIRRVYLAQKDIEILEKVKLIFGSNHKIIKNKQPDKINIIHYFSFTNKKIFDSLINLGLVAKKSLVLKFPDVPEEYVRHFLRGCWDGSFYIKLSPLQAIKLFPVFYEGVPETIYFSKKYDKLFASYKILSGPCGEEG